MEDQAKGSTRAYLPIRGKSVENTTRIIKNNGQIKMKSHELAKIISSLVVDDVVNSQFIIYSYKYKEEHNCHHYPFYDSLNEEQKKMFFEVIERIVSDTTSATLGILTGEDDGLDGLVSIVSEGEKIVDLQEMFLADQEDKGAAIGKPHNPTF